MGRMPFNQHPFWRSQCPRRGVSLVHAWAPGDPPGICVHCGDYPRVEEDEAKLKELPISVSERLRKLGFGSTTGNPPEEGVIDEDAPLAVATDLDAANDREKEPVMGLYPGPAWGQGRSWRGDGELSPRDKSRLIYYTEHAPRKELK